MRMRARLLLPIFVASLLVGVIWPAPAHPQDATADDAAWDQMRERFDGVWVLASSRTSARRTVDAAVDRAVDAMNFFLRGVARPMVRSNTPLNLEVELRFRSQQRIFVRFDDRARYTTPLGETSREQTLEGDPMRVTQRFRAQTLEQVFEAEQGTRWNVYTLLPDGRMRIDATTSADMMPQPMRFSLTYRRR